MNVEQRDQLVLVMEALKRDFYHPLGKISLSGFKAEKKLSLSEAETYERSEFPVGMAWGNNWEYAWMFADIVIPEAAKGERIVMNLNPGGESTLFVDGTPFGTRRAPSVTYPHHYIVDQTLTRCAEGGEVFALAMEVYGGTPLPFSPKGRSASGPVFPDEGVPMTGTDPAVVQNSDFGIWNEEAYQLWLDLMVLLDVYDTQDADSFLKEKIGYMLGELLDTLDMEQPLAVRRQAYAEARTFLEPLMQAHNGTFAPSMGAIGNSHLDVAWLWPLAETQRKTIRTFSQQLRLLEEYPEALFLQSQCVLYEMCQKQYPELFEKIREAVARGQWIAEGAMWVEPDTNMAGGEALIRQFIYGKKYFKEELGVDSRIAWLPDSFGYSAVLPQILAGCEVDGLTTQKIFWSYNDAEAFPYHAFQWKGMDGTTVPCYLHMRYESEVDVKTLCTRWHDRLIKDGSGDFYLPFGYGDGGGGPTRDDMEQIRRERDLQGVPKMRYETPNMLFERRTKEKLPVYRGELYFQCHRGTYTTQAATKLGNRRSEQAMRAYELWAACAAWLKAAEYPAEHIEHWWKQVLLNQFHDILPGSSIARVYEEALALYEEIFAAAGEGTAAALEALSIADDTKNGVTIWHGQSCERRQLVELDASFANGAVTAEGEKVACMKTETGALALVDLPSMGSVSLCPCDTDIQSAAVTASVCDGRYVLENEKLRAVFNGNGELVEVRDAVTGKLRIGGVSNRMHLYRDLPRAFDAWDIDSQTELREIPMNAVCSAEIVQESGLRAGIKFEMAFGGSKMSQIVSLDAGACRLDFETDVDWHERHKLLKVSFDTGIDAVDAANQMQFGHVMRPTHRSHRFDQDRFEVCNHGFTALYDATHGAAVLNDCKYGVSMQESEILLSLLRGATNPDPAADQGQHHFGYSYFFWDGAFEESGIVQETAAKNVPVQVVPGVGAKTSFFAVDNANIVIETVKLAEDGSGDMIVRLYESMNGSRKAVLETAFDVSEAWECSMLENKQKKLCADDGKIEMEFRPFEIKTVRLKK